MVHSANKMIANYV